MNGRRKIFERTACRIIGAACAIAVVLATFPAAAAESPIDTSAATRAWAQRQAECDRDGGRLWGISVCGPQLFVDPQTRAVVANVDSPSLHAVVHDGIFAGTLPTAIIPANTGFAMDGQRWSMVMWPLPNDPIERRILVMHESWHRIQETLGLPASNPPNDHLDTADGRYWLQLEWRALARALVSSGTVRRAAVDDALSFRAQRVAMFPNAVATENALMLNEGLAEDTGIAMTTAPADRAARAVERLGNGRGRSSYVRSFAYASGPAYGALLDVAKPGWRRGLRATTDLAHVLASAYRVQPVAARAGRRVAAYDDGGLRAAEDARSARLAVRLAAYRATLVDGPVLRIPLRGSRFGFNPNLVTPLPGAGSVYGDFSLNGWFGTLEADSGALLSSDFETAYVAAPPDRTTTQTAAWKLTLAPGCALVPAERSGDVTIACNGPK